MILTAEKLAELQAETAAEDAELAKLNTQSAAYRTELAGLTDPLQIEATKVARAAVKAEYAQRMERNGKKLKRIAAHFDTIAAEQAAIEKVARDAERAEAARLRAEASAAEQAIREAEEAANRLAEQEAFAELVATKLAAKLKGE